MTKLYKRNELWFSLLWIAVYVIAASAADSASQALGVLKAVTLPVQLALSAALLVWILRNGLAQKYGLCAPNAPAKRFLYYLPLAVVASAALWSGVGMNYTPVETALYMLSMVCVGFLEEVIFRGLLFRAIEKESLPRAVVISSLTFGIGHIVNAVNGSGQGLAKTLVQIVFAILAGFALVLLFLRGGSLLPCIAFHAANNALSAIGVESASPLPEALGFAARLVLLAGYALYLYKLKAAPTGKQRKL